MNGPTEREQRWAKCLYPTYEPAKILSDPANRAVIEAAMALSDTEDEERHEWDGWGDDL